MNSKPCQIFFYWLRTGKRFFNKIVPSLSKRRDKETSPEIILKKTLFKETTKLKALGFLSF
jgi:hypothetical protein